MLIKSALVTQASGSIGGLTASRNAGGQYFRARTIPVNPSSAQQIAVRNALAILASAWNNSLTQAQRDAWTTYGKNVNKTNSLGDQIKLSGISWYQACNVPRLQALLSRVDAAPTNYSLAELTEPEVDSVDAGSGQADVTFDNGDPWATAVGGALLIYVSRPQNPGKTFFKGPYRLAATVLGAATPPTSPATVDLPFPVVDGQRLFFQARAVQADGRISSAIRFQSLVA